MSQIPDLTVDYDLRRRTFTILHQEEVTSLSANLGTAGLQSNVSSIKQNLQIVENSQSWSDLSNLFSCKRIEVISHDGVLIPLLILYSREAHCHGESPGILYGYGAYGEELDKNWCSERLSLLSRGWVLAFADVRYVQIAELQSLPFLPYFRILYKDYLTRRLALLHMCQELLQAAITKYILMVTH